MLDQLRAGVRYLDLRTARLEDKHASSANLRVVHSLAGVTTLQVLRQVAAFLEETSHEVVVLDFQHFYGLAHTDHKMLVSSIIQLFGAGSIVPPTLTKAALSKLWEARHRVLILYGDEKVAQARPELLLYRPLFIFSPWAGDGQTKDAVARQSFKATLEGYMVNDARECLLSNPNTHSVMPQNTSGSNPRLGSPSVL